MSDFYVILPSNTHASCTSSDYYVRPPSPLHLQGQWEVALTSIILPVTWDNVPGDPVNSNQPRTSTIIFIINNEKWNVVAVTLPGAFYATVAELISAIHTCARETEANLSIEGDSIAFADHFSFSYDQVFKRVTVTFDKSQIAEIHLSDHLRYILGFENRILISQTETAKYTPDLSAGMNLIYIYTDLVEPTIVGNSRASLLRILHVDHNLHGDTIEKLFQNPLYLPVISKEVEKITINLKFDSGKTVPFAFGNTVATLHFRKRRFLL